MKITMLHLPLKTIILNVPTSYPPSTPERGPSTAYLWHSRQLFNTTVLASLHLGWLQLRLIVTDDVPWMRDDATMWCRLSLAGHFHKMIPAKQARSHYVKPWLLSLPLHVFVNKWPAASREGVYGHRQPRGKTTCKSPNKCQSELLCRPDH